MHELALARYLIDLVEESLPDNPAPVCAIDVRLGEASAMARALHFCFASVARGTRCEGAVLRIEEVPLTIRCRHCNTVGAPTGRYNFRCPECGRPAHEIVTGKEAELKSIELGDRVSVRTANPLPELVGRHRHA
ncbi:MAG: hydrogenase maturation nickel metallochaperone HypA [Pseudomonadota bacterium]